MLDSISGRESTVNETAQWGNTGAIRFGKLKGSLVAIIQPKGALRQRYRISRYGEGLYALAEQLRQATHGYRYSPTADAEVKRILFHRVRSAARRAKRLGWECDITLDWAIERYNEQEGKCILSGLPLDTGPCDADTGRKRRPFRPSLDRIDSRGGYTQDNVRLVCSCVNYALGPWGEGVLRVMAAALVNN